ncbi:MAG: YeeE/YedE family protein [Nannocystaceae bacterium]|nr:YeeE/YedE family protein [Nannocystaceae bacterium]
MSRMRFDWLALACGVVFGGLLQRAGATDYDAIARMFLLEDLHLMGVMGVAMVVAGTGLAIIRRARHGVLARFAPFVQPKPMKVGLVLGAAIFGAGWAITGTCPGTGLAQLGEGKIMALFTVLGMLGGTALYLRWGPALERRLQR